MEDARARPWNPDRRWADPLITLLLLCALLGTLGAAARRGPQAEPQRPGLQARFRELGRSARGLLPTPLAGGALEIPAGAPFWDRALLALLAAEEGEPAPGRRLALENAGEGPAREAFRRCWRAAYEGGGPPAAGESEALREPLGGGFAYWSLRARLAERAGQDPAPFRALARAWARPRLAALALWALLGLGGLVAAPLLLLAGQPRPPAPLPAFAMSWRALLLALLGWFIAFRVSGTFALLCLSILPLPKAMAVPIAYAFHVAVGASLLLRAEGLSLREAWRRATPGPLSRALGWAVAFLGITIAAVFLAGLLAAPLVRGAEAPQRELMELVSSLRNPLATLLLLLTIAGLAPLFEEWLFRGVLLPWLGPRLAPRLGARAGWGAAVLLSGLAFGAVHFQPAGLPTLATLGIVLGWAFLRTGSLWTTVAVHGCWNAAVFLLVRSLA